MYLSNSSAFYFIVCTVCCEIEQVYEYSEFIIWKSWVGILFVVLSSFLPSICLFDCPPVFNYITLLLLHRTTDKIKLAWYKVSLLKIGFKFLGYVIETHKLIRRYKLTLTLDNPKRNFRFKNMGCIE